MRRILIVDDHEVVREGIKRILEAQMGDTVFGEADTAREAKLSVEAHDWDAVVLDLSLGDRSGLGLLKELKELRPRLPVLILSIHPEELYARRALKSGAAGYLTKSSPRQELVNAVRRVVEGGRYVSPGLAERLAGDLTSGRNVAPHETLSDREFEVVRMIASGKTLTQIAETLSLSDKTISTYRARVLHKLGFRNNAELTRYMIENQLV